MIRHGRGFTLADPAATGCISIARRQCRMLHNGYAGMFLLVSVVPMPGVDIPLRRAALDFRILRREDDGKFAILGKMAVVESEHYLAMLIDVIGKLVIVDRDARLVLI